MLVLVLSYCHGVETLKEYIYYSKGYDDDNDFFYICLGTFNLFILCMFMFWFYFHFHFSYKICSNFLPKYYI